MRILYLVAFVSVIVHFIACGVGNKSGSSGIDIVEPSALSLLSTALYGTYDADGQWMAWTAFDSSQMLAYDGSTVIDLTAVMDPRFVPLGSVFDGRYIVFLTTDGIAYQLFHADIENGATPVYLAQAPLNTFPFEGLMVENGLATWSNSVEPGNYEVYYCDLTVPTPAIVRLTNDFTGLDDRFPVTDGRYIAWEGETADGTDLEVFYFDTNDPGSGEVRLTDNDWSDSFVRLDQGVIAWEGEAAGAETASEIFAFVMGSGPAPMRLTSNNWSDRAPEVREGFVRWTAVHPSASWGEIHISDAINASDSNVRVTSNTTYESWISSSGSVVAWEQDDAIYFFDLSEGASTAQPHLVWQGDFLSTPVPFLNDEDIVWEAGVYPTNQIYAYNIGSWPSTAVAIIGDKPCCEDLTRVNGGIATWIAKDFSDTYNINYAMYAHDLADPAGSDLVIIAQDHRDLFVETRTAVGGQLRAAWIPQGNLPRLYAKKYQAPGDPILITPQNMAAGYMKVAQGKVAWFGYTEAAEGQVYYADLDSMAMTVHQATAGTRFLFELDFDGTVIAWDEGLYYNRDIFYYDLTSPSPTPVAQTSRGQASYPRVDDGIIAWLENDGSDEEIRYANVGGVAHTLTDNDFDDSWPALSGGMLCWRGGPGTTVTQDIFCADVVNAPQTVIRVTSNDDYEGPPDVDEGVVVWPSATGDTTPWSMFAYDFGSQQTWILETGPGPMGPPYLENGLVTWHQGEFAWDDPPAEIHAQYIRGSSRTEIVNGGYNVYPKPGDGYLLWNLYINHLYMAVP